MNKEGLFEKFHIEVKPEFLPASFGLCEITKEGPISFGYCQYISGKEF